MPKTTDGLVQPFKSYVEAFLARTVGWTVLLSAYRSSQEQFDLRGRNGCLGREYNSACKGNPLTAIPGTSNHERGLAIDVHPSDGDFTTMHLIAAEYGIHFPLFNGTRARGLEPWHGELSGNEPTAPIDIPISQEDLSMADAATIQAMIADLANTVNANFLYARGLASDPQDGASPAKVYSELVRFEGDVYANLAMLRGLIPDSETGEIHGDLKIDPAILAAAIPTDIAQQVVDELVKRLDK